MRIRSDHDAPAADPAPLPGVGRLFYLYGVVLTGSDAHRRIGGGYVQGVEPEQPLFPIEAEGLVAAVSHVSADVFDELPLNALVTDLPRLTPYAVRHEEAVRALLGSALIPMTFGAVYRGVEGVQSMLRERADEFRALLSWLQGRQEWGVKVFAVTSHLRQVAEEESPALRALAEEMAAATPGRAYLLVRKRERVLADEASRLAGEVLTEIVSWLSGLSAATVRDDPGPAHPGSEQLVLKEAYLVDETAFGAFCSAVAELEQTHSRRGFRIEMSGPWAPYSFVRDRRGLNA